MGIRSFLALFLLFLLLGFEVQGALSQDEPGSTLLAQMQKSLFGYWHSAKRAAQGLYENSYITAMDEKIRDVYSKSTAAVTTYAGIFTDQLLSMMKGEQ